MQNREIALRSVYVALYPALMRCHSCPSPHSRGLRGRREARLNKLIGYAFLAAMLPTGPVGNEINGFRLGMSIEAAKQRAIEKGYILGRGTKSTSNWISFVLAN